MNVYRLLVARFLQSLSEDSARIHIPGPNLSRRHYPGMFSHLTPELFLQEAGTTVFTCPSERFHLRKDEIALIPRGVSHGEKARDGAQPFRGLVLCFHGNQLILILSKKLSPDGTPTVDFSDSFEGSEVAPAQRYLDDAAAIPTLSPTAAKQRAALIFAALAKIHDLLLSLQPVHPAEPTPHPKVLRCRELIQAYLNNPKLGAAHLARQVGCSSDHLSRCFRRETGMSLLQYLRQERINRACDLLRHPHLNVSEIAWACGFNSLNYFVRSFRQQVGQSPGHYRRRLA